MVQFCYTNFEEGISKKLINFFIGDLNTKYLKNDFGCITNSYEITSRLWSDIIENNGKIIINKVDDLYLVRNHKRTRNFSDSSSIWRQIVREEFKIH